MNRTIQSSFNKKKYKTPVILKTSQDHKDSMDIIKAKQNSLGFITLKKLESRLKKV